MNDQKTMGDQREIRAPHQGANGFESPMFQGDISHETSPFAITVHTFGVMMGGFRKA
jgi:hypothetical protein